MKKLLLIGSAFSLLVPHLRGQEVVRFDTVRFNQVGSFATGNSVFELENGFRVFGLQKGLSDQSQDIYVTSFDPNGGVVAESTIQTYRQDNIGQASPIIATGTGYYAGLVLFGVGDFFNDSLFLYKYGLDGDTVWTRFVAVDSTFTMRGLARTDSGDLLITGLHEFPEEAYVYRLDSMGMIKSYHGFANLDGEDVVEGKDGSWFVGGRGNVVGNLNRAVLIRSDTLGNELWRRTDTQYGRCLSLIALKAGGVVALGTTGVGNEGGYSLAAKYDTSGAQVWRKELLQTDESDRPSEFHAGFETEDSSLVLCGWIQRSDLLSKGTLVKLSKEGDPQWSRLYSHYDVSSISLWQLFWDVKPTSDGGLVLTGEANSADYPYAQLWLLKLDSLGCLVPGCNTVGVEEVVTDLQSHLIVSPNPARDNVRVELQCPEGFAPEGDVRVLLLDANGRVVAQQKAVSNLDRITCTLDVSGYASGTYFVHLADRRRWLAGSKVVVE